MILIYICQTKDVRLAVWLPPKCRLAAATAATPKHLTSSSRTCPSMSPSPLSVISSRATALLALSRLCGREQLTALSGGREEAGVLDLAGLSVL